MELCLSSPLVTKPCSPLRIPKPILAVRLKQLNLGRSIIISMNSLCRTISAATSSPVNHQVRIGEVKRVTKETNVSVKINLDGSGIADSSTGIPFLDHMLDQLASHGLFGVRVKASGDTHIDDHHTNEDVALAMGTALLQALGDRKGLTGLAIYQLH